MYLLVLCIHRVFVSGFMCSQPAQRSEASQIGVMHLIYRCRSPCSKNCTFDVR